MGPEERKLSEVKSAEPDEVRRASSTWSRLSQDLGEVADVLRGKVDREIDTSWHGQAADLARDAFGQLAAAVEKRAQSMQLVSKQLGEAATALASAKSDLANLGPAVPPAPDPTGVDFSDPSQEVTFVKLSARHTSLAAEREDNARRAYTQLESSLADSESAMGEDMADDFRAHDGSTRAYTGSGGSGPSTTSGGYTAPGATPSSGPGGGGPRSPILVPGSGPTDYHPGGTHVGQWTPGGSSSGDGDGGLTADAGPGGDATPWTPGQGGTGGGATAPYGSGGSGGGFGAGAGAVAGVGGVLGGALGLGKAARGGGAGSVGGGAAPGARGAGGRVIGGVAPTAARGAGAGGAGGRAGAGGRVSGVVGGGATGAGGQGGRGAALGARGAGRGAPGVVPGAGGGAGASSGAGGRGGSRAAGVRPTGSVGSAGGRAPAGAGGTSGGRGVPPTVAARGARDEQDPEAVEALAVEDDWFGEDESAPDVLR
jgi:hypothetical protein